MSEISISKRSFYLYQLVLLLAIFLALFYWYKSSKEFVPVPIPRDSKGSQELVTDDKQVPISNKLRNFANKEGYQIMMLINSKGQIKVADLEKGKSILACGLKVGTEITGNCDLRGQPTHSNEIKITRYTRNPNCKVITIGPHIITYHDGGDGFPRYSWPCHVSSQHN